MKKIIGFAMMVLVSACAVAQNKVDKNGLKQGHWVKYYDNGKVMYDGNFSKGKPVGEFVRYYSNGKLKLKQNFDVNSDRVYTEMYRDNGKILSKGYFKNEKRVGEWTTYSQKGEVIQVDNYSEVGLLDGVSTVYDAQGRVFETTEWKNGKREGSHKQYFPNGQLQSEVNYANGLREGDFVTYFDDGKTESKGQYLADKKDSIWVVFDRDGKTQIASIEYVRGIATNQLEIDANEQKDVKQNDENAGKMKDPADYQTSVEDFFNDEQVVEEPSKVKNKKRK